MEKGAAPHDSKVRLLEVLLEENNEISCFNYHISRYLLSQHAPTTTEDDVNVAEALNRLAKAQEDSNKLHKESNRLLKANNVLLKKLLQK